MKAPHPTAGLWWSAVTILVVGSAVTYAVSLDRLSTERSFHMAVVGGITIIAAGLLVIGATSQWWLKR